MATNEPITSINSIDVLTDAEDTSSTARNKHTEELR